MYAQGKIWISRAVGAELTSVDALKGTVLATVVAGPHPRFLTAGGGAVWTLNQGDGSLTRIDLQTHATRSILFGTPGGGGHIKFGAGMSRTTLATVPLSLVDANSAVAAVGAEPAATRSRSVRALSG